MSTGDTHRMTDMRESMRTVRTIARAKQLIGHMQQRLASIELVRWPRLEQSFRDELTDIQAIARERFGL